jgi:hypothetical protein
MISSPEITVNGKVIAEFKANGSLLTFSCGKIDKFKQYDITIKIGDEEFSYWVNLIN